MTDIVSKRKRSQMMRGIKSKNTKPEIIIRKALWAKGFRYRLHKKNLPGKPDLFLKQYNAAILVNGCFWHYHDCHMFKMPKHDFWQKKITANKERDRRQLTNLKEFGIRVLIVWECSMKGKHRKDPGLLIDEITTWLTSDSSFGEIGGIAE